VVGPFVWLLLVACRLAGAALHVQPGDWLAGWLTHNDLRELNIAPITRHSAPYGP